MELLQLHQQRILGYIYALLHNLADAEDVYQQTSLILWRKFDAFDPESDFYRWACKVAHFEVLNFLRAKKCSHVHFSESFLEELAAIELPSDDTALRQRHEALTNCIERLPERDRRLIDLCYGGEQTFKQVAEQLGRSVQGVYNSLGRVRGILFDCIHRILAAEGER